MLRGSWKSFLAGAAFIVALARSGPAAASPPDLSTDDLSLPPATAKHPFALMLAEQFAALSVQGVWYWGHSQYGTSGSAVTAENFFKSLVSDDFVLEDDSFRTNGLGHPLAGAFAYQIARGNGYGVGASILASVVSSVVWKYFGEWNQTHSTNDIIMSPGAGWVMGEATYRIGRWFAAGEPGIFNCVGASLLSPFATLNGSSVCGFRGGDRPPGTTVLPSWHRLAAEVGPSVSTFDGGDPRTGFMIGLGGRLRTSTQYLSPGAGSSTAWPGQWTSAGLRLLIENGALRGSAFDADALVIGRFYRRHADADGGSSGPDGWSALIGFGSSFAYDSRQLPIAVDRTATAGLLGPELELSVRHGSLELRAWLTAKYAFSQVTSLAYEQAAQSFAGVTLKSVLEREGYYYAQGPVSSAALEGEMGGVRIALEGWMANYWSIDSDYSNQSEIQNNFSLRDTRIFTRAVASVQPLGGPLRIAVELDDDLRDSRIPGTVVRTNERRFMASLAIVSR